MHSLAELLKFIWRSTKTIVIFVVGVTLIVAGLAVLATEFAWAQAMLDKAKEKASQAGSAAKKGLSRFRRRKPEATEPTG